MTTTDGQLRAKVGGEFGANGEWYEGGKFIATKDNRKLPPKKQTYTEEETAAYLKRKAERANFEANHAIYLSARRTEFKNLIAYLIEDQNFNHTPEVWQNLVESYAAGFYPSLGWELHQHGYLSPRQAEFVCKLIHGRRNKKNATGFDTLYNSLIITFAQFQSQQA
jgi:hypothetical protein